MSMNTVSIRCREYIFKGGGSNKYWTYFVVDGAGRPGEYSTHWFAHSGRVGTAGIWHTFLRHKPVPSERIHEKVNEGYRPTGPEYSILVAVTDLMDMQKNINRELLGKELRDYQLADTTGTIYEPQVARTKPRPRSEVAPAKPPKNREQLADQLDKLMNL